jgi:hypothetical protein
MPHRLKIRTAGTDAGSMSETALTPPNETPTTTHESLLLDGDAPRLGSTPLAAPAPMGGAGTPVVNDTPAAPTLPVVSPVLTDPSAPMQSGTDVFADMPAPAIPAAAAPAIPAPELPTLPAAAPAVPTSAAPQLDDTAGKSTSDMADAEHPMAHLMGGPTQVSQASQRAAELRAAKKAKAKKLKIGFAIGAVVVTAAVGPPLWSWFTDALNEAGNTSTEAPAD